MQAIVRSKQEPRLFTCFDKNVEISLWPEETINFLKLKFFAKAKYPVSAIIGLDVPAILMNSIHLSDLKTYPTLEGFDYTNPDGKVIKGKLHPKGYQITGEKVYIKIQEANADKLALEGFVETA
jgi:hypothetical protein